MLSIGNVAGGYCFEGGRCLRPAIGKCDTNAALTVIKRQGAFLVYSRLVYFCRLPLLPSTSLRRPQRISASCGYRLAIRRDQPVC